MPIILKLPNYLTTDEVRRFLTAAETPSPGYDPVKWTAFWRVTYYYGLRRGEAAALKVTDIDRQRGRIQITPLKQPNPTPVSYPIIQSVKPYLRAWLDQRRGRSEYLFPSKRGGQMTGEGVRKAFLRCCALAGIKANGRHPFGPHLLRHSIATHILTAGADMHDVQDLLRHSSINSTAIYARITNQRRDRTMKLMAESNEIA